MNLRSAREGNAANLADTNERSDGSLAGTVSAIPTKLPSEPLLREEYFRLLVTSIKNYAIFMLDPSGHIASWNAGAEQTKGYNEAEVLGQHFSIFYTTEDIARGLPEHNLQIAARD